MIDEFKMKSYKAPRTVNDDSKHQVLLTFQFNTGFAQLVTEYNGEIAGAELLSTIAEWVDEVAKVENDLVVSFDNEINKKHAIYFAGEKKSLLHPYGKVQAITFYHLSEVATFNLGIEEAVEYLIGVQIIGYESGKESEGGED